MESYCYSLDEERFHDRFDTREEALAEARENTEYTVWTGVVHEASDIIKKFTLACRVFECAEEFLADEIGWDDTILEYTPELEAELNTLIVTFLSEKCSFNAFGVKDVQRHR